MRTLLIAATMVAVSVGLSPRAALAGGPGHGVGFGVTLGGPGPSVYIGSGGGWHHGPGYPGHGPGWYPGYGPGWGVGLGYPVAPYVVERPVLVNPVPVPVYSGASIKIVNPATNSSAVSYTLNGIPYTIQPGEVQEFPEDRAWVVDFNRGMNLGMARYGLHAGLYTFSMTERGWELYNGPMSGAATSPVVPPPPAPSMPAP